VYTFWLLRKRSARAESSLGNEKQRLKEYVFFTFLAAIGVVISSLFIVDSASYIAGNIGMSPVAIGSTVVAFGTSVPVLAVSIDAVRKGHLDLALGNIVGTCFMNTTFILGIPLIALPLRIDLAAFSSLVMFSVITSLFLWYFLSSERISWREGAVLVFMYFLFLTISLGGYRV